MLIGDIMPSINDLKKLHDIHATTINILTSRIQFYFEEFKGVQEMIQLYTGLCEQLKKQIEELEKESKNVESPESTSGTPV